MSEKLAKLVGENSTSKNVILINNDSEGYTVLNKVLTIKLNQLSGATRDVDSRF